MRQPRVLGRAGIAALAVAAVAFAQTPPPDRVPEGPAAAEPATRSRAWWW